jgi:hypothetical protein
MGGGRAGAPADDGHVPGLGTSPWRSHSDFAGHGAGRPGWADPDSRLGAGPGPDPARKADREGQGRTSAKQPKAEEGLRKSADSEEPLRQTVAMRSSSGD